MMTMKCVFLGVVAAGIRMASAQGVEVPGSGVGADPVPAVEVRKSASSLFSLGATKGGDTNAPQRESVITADKIDFDNKEGVILFDKNVMVDDAQFTLCSDRLLVFMEGTNDLNQILAIGNVMITNALRSATCAKAVYTRKDGQIVMTGDVHMRTSGSNAGEVQGDRVVIWVDDERMEVFPGRLVLPPGTFNKASGEIKKTEGASTVQ